MFDVELDQSLVNQIIAQHLFREGKFEVGELFLKVRKERRKKKLFSAILT